MKVSQTPRVFTTDDPMPVDYPFHLSRVKIGVDQEDIRERVDQIHSHEYLQVLMILDGQIDHQSCATQKTMKKGQLVCIPAFQKHRDHYEIGAEVVTISFMPSIIDSLFANPHLLGRSGHFSEPFLASFFLPSQEEFRCLKPCDEDFEKLLHLVDEMMAQQKGSGPLRRIGLHTRVMQYLLILQAHVDMGDWFERDSCHEALEEILAYLQRNYHETIAIEDLIKKSGLSGTLFRKEFKSLTGRSCLQYLNELRIFHAITAIRNSSRNLKGIALDVGFDEFATFHRVFKRIKGVGPKTFRDGLKVQFLGRDPKSLD